MDNRRIWAVRAGNAGQADHIFLDQRQLAISSADVADDVSALPPSRAEFGEIVAQMAGADSDASTSLKANQLYRFVHEVRIGDCVIYPRKCDRTLHWGVVTGPYVFEGRAEAEFSHRRAVEWRNALSRDMFSQASLYELGAALTLFEVRSFADEFRSLFETRKPDAAARAQAKEDVDAIVLRDINEATIDFIAKKLQAELKGYPMEGFVADLFRAMGYRAHATRNTRDDGIDVIAHRDELGIEPPILKIQVKAHDGNIGADPVKSFSAMIPDRDVGVFITTGGYSAGALDFARTRSNIRLLNGIEFIALIQKHYDQLDPRRRRQIPLRRVLVPDVGGADGET